MCASNARLSEAATEASKILSSAAVARFAEQELLSSSYNCTAMEDIYVIIGFCPLRGQNRFLATLKTPYYYIYIQSHKNHSIKSSKDNHLIQWTERNTTTKIIKVKNPSQKAF
jgi:hypothetical protein